jgi:hypothetical protein
VPCIRFTQVEAKRALQKIEQSFMEAVFSHVKHTLFALEESELPQMTYACESQWRIQPTSVWTSHWQTSSASPEGGGRSSPAHIQESNRSKAWATTLSKTYLSWPESHETRHAKALKVIWTQAYLQLLLITFKLVISQVKLISKNRLSAYANHAKLTQVLIKSTIAMTIK